MIYPKIRSTLISFITVCLILGISLGLIAYGRGYRLNFTNKALSTTGLLVAGSDPTGAQVLVDGKIKGATNSTLNLAPGWYDVTVVKEGYQPWEKRVRIQGEVVSRIDAFLFPVNPSLSAISSSGVTAPAISPDGSKLVYIVPTQSQTNNGYLPERSGIWILDLTDKPLGLNRDARQIAKSTPVDWSKAVLSWSPDSKQVLAQLTLPNKIITNYLLNTDKLNENTLKVTDLNNLNLRFKSENDLKEKEKLATLAPEILAMATSSAKNLKFAPDETKILYEATVSATLSQIIKPALIGTNSTVEDRRLAPGNLYVYDLKEDRNYLLGPAKNLPSPSWLPTSRHLLLVSKDKIEVMEYDGFNRKTVYAGPFRDNFAAPWMTSSKLLIMTNLNPSASTIANLYAINLR